MTDKKTFDISEKAWSGYDLGTFMGRLQYYREVCSPEKSFNSTSTIKQYLSDVRSTQKTADQQGKVQMTQAEYDAYRTKRLILASSTSPDTGEVIPWAMRTCSFVPTNIPIIAGMLLSPPTQVYTMFWQWLN